MIGYLYQREPAVKHIIPLRSFLMLLLMWSCWEGVSCMLVSVQRKCNHALFPWVPRARNYCSSPVHRPGLAGWQPGWLGQQSYAAIRGFGNLESQFWPVPVADGPVLWREECEMSFWNSIRLMEGRLGWADAEVWGLFQQRAEGLRSWTVALATLLFGVFVVRALL